MTTKAIVVVAPFLCVTTLDSAAQDEGFLSWASESLHPIVYLDTEAPTSDLAALGEMIGSARIVAFGEGQHAAAEPMVFRNRLFRYLVEELGFSAIAIESGTVESRTIYDYIRGGPGAINEVVALGISATLDDFPQNTSLVHWMRTYNEGQSDERKVSFFGFDVPGSPTNGFAIRGVDTAIKEAIAFVRDVDVTSASAIAARVEPFLPLSLDTYGQLSQPDRDQLTVVVADLVAMLKRREWDYVEASSRSDYDWAYIAALGAQQIDDFLRFVPLGWTQRDGFAWADEGAFLQRDRAMMDNIDWILDQLDRDARILIFGAISHLLPVPLTRPGSEQQQIPVVPVGVYLNQRYRGDVLTIGNIIADGEIGNCPRGPLLTLDAPPESSLSHLFARLGVPQFVLDLRTPPSNVASIFSQPSDLWNGFISWSVVVSDAIDIAYFSGPVTPACSRSE
jgi:erythromycin esterase